MKSSEFDRARKGAWRTKEPRSERHAALMTAPMALQATCPPCNQRCNQGRDCPTRQACEVPERESAPLFASSRRASAAVAVALVIGAAVVASILAGWLR